MNTRNITRIIVKASLAAGILLSVYIIWVAFKSKEWSTIASSLSVITAILAIFISLNVTWRQEDQKDPQLSLSIDNKSHKYVYSLVIKNSGGSPAYNVKIHWHKPLINFQKKATRFTDFEENNDFDILVNGDSFSTLALTADNYQNLCQKSEEPLVYHGEISYSLTPKNKNIQRQTFNISLESYKWQLNTASDQHDFYSENKDLSKVLGEIKELMKKNKTI